MLDTYMKMVEPGFLLLFNYFTIYLVIFNKNGETRDLNNLTYKTLIKKGELKT